MFKHNLRNLYQGTYKSLLSEHKLKTVLAKKISQRQLSEVSRMLLLRDSKLLPNLFNLSKNKEKNMLNHFAPKRNFNQRLDNFLAQLISRLPGGNIGYVMVALNTLFYFLYLIWPPYRMYSFLNNFTFSRFNLSRGYLHTLFTCHFAHMSFLTYLLDTIILYLFCSNLSMMYGPLFVTKLILLSMGIGSLFLFLQHQSGFARPFYGNDAIMRGLIFAVIFQNPAATFYLIPLPIPIPAWFIAVFLLGIDFLSFNTAGFGGVTAAYLMLNYL